MGVWDSEVSPSENSENIADVWNLGHFGGAVHICRVCRCHLRKFLENTGANICNLVQFDDIGSSKGQRSAIARGRHSELMKVLYVSVLPQLT